MKEPRISIVIPVFNEQENLPELHSRLKAVMQQTGESYEIIFVDDGSQDESRSSIRKLSQNNVSVRGLFLSRNFGHQAAIAAGIDHACGNAVIAMDSDLQDPPEFIPRLIQEWIKGFEVVYAVRRKRKENITKRGAYRIFYLLLGWIANVDIPVDSGDFALMDRKVVEHIKKMPERNRFMRGLRSWVGFKQVGVEYERDARHAGEAKYTLRKLLKLAIDGVMSFSYFPLRLAFWLGLLSFLTCLAYIAYALYGKLALNSNPPGWTSLMIAVMLLGGTQLVLIGIVGEYIARIYDEVKQRPYYIVDETVNFE